MRRETGRGEREREKKNNELEKRPSCERMVERRGAKKSEREIWASSIIERKGEDALSVTFPLCTRTRFVRQLFRPSAHRLQTFCIDTAALTHALPPSLVFPPFDGIRARGNKVSKGGSRCPAFSEFRFH